MQLPSLHHLYLLTFIYEGQPTNIRIQGKIHVEDVDIIKFPGPNLILIVPF